MVRTRGWVFNERTRTVLAQAAVRKCRCVNYDNDFNGKLTSPWHRRAGAGAAAPVVCALARP